MPISAQPSRPLLLTAALLLVAAAAAAQTQEEGVPEEGAAAAPLRPTVDFSLEVKTHFRDSDENRFPVNIAALPPPLNQQELATVNPGSHLEVSTVTLYLDAAWGESLAALVKVDLIDLYDRNPTSGDRQVDVDEAWIRFGRETEPALLPERAGIYLKLGKMPKLERQDDRHLESYGLVSTVFNRFEDLGVELGVDLGRHLYLKATATQGNPVFMRDPNALAGDNGLESQLVAGRTPQLGSGILIPYDAEIEGLDTDGDLETGGALGLRFADAGGERGVDFMVFGYRRTLAETVELEGTLYGGDLDLLRGPGNAFPFALTDDEKREAGANLWLYLGGFSFFAQYVDQDLGGLGRTGFEAEAAWRFDLPVRFAVAGRQLFTSVAPAVRYSRLDPDFAAPAGGPTPSFAWDWEKIDVGVRLGILRGIDLTLEYADNAFVLASGAERSNNEMLATLRWRT